MTQASETTGAGAASVVRRVACRLRATIPWLIVPVEQRIGRSQRRAKHSITADRSLEPLVTVAYAHDTQPIAELACVPREQRVDSA